MEFIVIIVMCVLMYVLMFLPQKKKEKQLKALRNNLEIGDVVIMECGIVGKVISVKDPESVTIETGSDKTRLKFKRWAIAAKEENKD